MADTYTRIPPQDLAAETCVLGSAILRSLEAMEEATFLSPSDFYSPDHRLIWTALEDLHHRGTNVDLVVLRDALKHAGQLEKAGGVDYLMTLAESVPTPGNMAHYAHIVKQCSMGRAVINSCVRAINDSYGMNCEGALNNLEKEIFQLSLKQNQRKTMWKLSELIAPLVKQIIAQQEIGRGLAAGFSDLDYETGGLHDGEVIIVAGRPSMGKSSLALNILEYLSIENGVSCLLFSLEMNELEVSKRFIITRSGVDSQQMRSGYLSDYDQKCISAAQKELAAAPLFIDANPMQTTRRMLSRARLMKAKYGVKLLVIDYLQLIQYPDNIKRMVEAYTIISREIKWMARELALPIILISQLSRAPETRETDKRPRLSDLRESGAIEQDADVVLLIYREDYYHRHQNSYTPTNLAEIDIAKQRQGDTGRILLNWNGPRMKFFNQPKKQEEDIPI